MWIGLTLTVGVMAGTIGVGFDSSRGAESPDQLGALMGRL